MISPNVVELTTVILTGVACIIPIAGITARIAMKPMAEMAGLLREVRRKDDAVADIDRRVAALEEHFGDIDRSLKLLVEDADFRRRLAAAAPPSTGETSAVA